VVAREEAGGDKRLVAYVVGAAQGQGLELDVAGLRAALAEQLPQYMVPAAFVVLQALPLTPNGKLDRRALPAPEMVEGGAEYVAPSTPLEELLAQCFEQVLGRPQVGRHDNFFELGGHSLMAMRVVSQLRQQLQLEVSVRTLFEAPSVAELALRVQELQAQGAGLSRPALQAQPRPEALPLSFAQERLWFLDQLQPGLAQYNMPAAVRLNGRLDEVALGQALQALVDRHEALRTRFEAVEGVARQRVQERLEVSWQCDDLSALAEDDAQAQARALTRREAGQAFDLQAGPLVRARLVRLKAQEHLALLTLHHIVSDGWSMGVLVRELAALYEQYAGGRAAGLAPLEVQYADYALWQRGWLQGQALQAQLDYWSERLRGAPTLLELPTDRVRPVQPSGRGGHQRVSLGVKTTAALRELARSEGVTPFMVLLAAYQLLLARLSGQRDIVVGSPIAGRTHAHTEALIGFFVNTLALRSRIELEDSFAQLLGQVREATLGAYAHQDLPFEKLVEALQPQRSLSHAPVFQAMFVLQNVPQSELQVPGLSFSGVAQDGETTKFDLTLELQETAQGLQGSLEYASDLFDAETIGRWARHFEHLVGELVSRAQEPLGRIGLLAPAERERLLSGWNETQREVPDGTLVELFEEQVSATPQAVALVYEGRELSYGELNDQANRLAHVLVGRGIGAEDIVALCLERGVEMVVSLLGILKAGAAYLPLDPAYPQERLVSMLEDARPVALLSEQRLGESLQEAGTPVVGVGRRGAEGAAGERQRGQPRQAGRWSEPGVRDLHLGLHGQAQGRGWDARGAGQPTGVVQPQRPVRAGQAGKAGACQEFAELHRRQHGTAGRAAARAHSADGRCAQRWGCGGAGRAHRGRWGTGDHAGAQSAGGAAGAGAGA